MERKHNEIRGKEKRYESGATLKTILMNAIKMQALYSGGKLQMIDTSNLRN